jgi:hypothetical protein
MSSPIPVRPVGHSGCGLRGHDDRSDDLCRCNRAFAFSMSGDPRNRLVEVYAVSGPIPTAPATRTLSWQKSTDDPTGKPKNRTAKI